MAVTAAMVVPVMTVAAMVMMVTAVVMMPAGLSRRRGERQRAHEGQEDQGPQPERAQPSGG
jgi:hypothetical protein